MKRIQQLSILWVALLMFSVMDCNNTGGKGEVFGDAPFLWENANIYFLLTDHFLNGDPSNDLNFDRSKKTAVMRGFQGGDIARIKRGRVQVDSEFETVLLGQK